MKGLRGSGDIRSYIRKQKKAGQTYGSIADSLGISTGTLYNWRKGRTSPRASTLDSVRDEILYSQAEQSEYVSWEQFQEESYMTGVEERKEQADAFEAEYGTVPSPDDEVRRITVEKTINGKKVKWLYGRGKDAEVKRAAIESLKKQGLSVSDALETYNEATGYSTA